MKNDKLAAVDQLASLMTEGFQPKRLDEMYDLLKLLGVVLGYIALLEEAVDGLDPKSRVSAARALVSLKEDPESIAERLRRSPFADLNVEQLQAIVHKVKSGETDLAKITQEVKDGHHGSSLGTSQ